MSDVKDISQLAEASMQEYNNASFRVIKDLQAKISKLEAENESLKIMLEQNVPALIDTSDLGFGVSNEALICETQICLLKNEAIKRSLTKEEVQKFQILTDISLKYKSVHPDAETLKAKQMTQEELLAAATYVET
jgi:hypothetical protein